MLTTLVANSTAMSLGASRGAATIGRPLNMSVPAVLGAEDRATDLADLCIEVDLAYGDRAIPRSRVQVSVDKPVTAATQNLIIRVRASELIDEPFVTMNLQMGCQQKLQRQYVLLADLEPEPARLPAVPLPGALPAASTAVPLQALAPLASQGGESSSPQTFRNGVLQPAPLVPAIPQPGERVAQTPAPRPAAAKPVAVAQRPRPAPRKPAAAKPVPTVESASAGRSRLSLDPMVPMPPAGGSAGNLNAPSTAETPQDRDAALWSALRAETAERLKDAEKILGLEATVLALQAQALRDRQNLQELQAQLDRARLERYVFAGLSLLVLLALGYAVWRNSRTQEAPWWREEGAPAAYPQAERDSSEDEDALEREAREILIDPEPQAQALQWPAKAGGDSAPVPATVAAAVAAVTPSLAKPPGGEMTPDAPVVTPAPAVNQKVDIEFDLEPAQAPNVPFLAWTDDGNVARVLEPTHWAGAPEEAEASVAEELIDVRQKADFFVSLGRHEHAAEAMRGYLSPDGYPNPRGYVELFERYHRLDRADDYEALRKTFKIQFDADVLPFALYDSQALADQIARASELARRPLPTDSGANPPEDELLGTGASPTAQDSGFALLDFDLDPLPVAGELVNAPPPAPPPPPAVKKVEQKPVDDSFFAQSDARWN